MKLHLLLTLLFAAVMLGAEPVTTIRPEPASPPAARLRSARMFTFDGMGFAGMPEIGMLALREIYPAKDAVEQLRAIYETATPEGKCYILVGLHTLDPKVFDECAAKFPLDRSPALHSMSGCFVESLSSETVLREIKNGRYDPYLRDLRSPAAAPKPAAPSAPSVPPLAPPPAAQH